MQVNDCSATFSESVETIISNEDLVTEILVHVPTKSLIKLKCVCKDWNSLISSSQFVYNQYTRNTKLVSGIYFHPNYWVFDALECLSHQGHLSSVNLPFIHELKNGKKCSFEHSCKGLTLFKDSFFNYYVCNLTTRKYVKLPQHPLCVRHENYAYLAFDPLSSLRYKVVLMSKTIGIYFSGNKSWRSIKVDETPNYSSPVAFWDGAIHWMNKKNTYFRFIVDEERLITTQLPPRPKILNRCNIRFFGECCDQLLLIQCRLLSVMGFTILEMKKGTCHWTTKHRVNLRHVPHVLPTKGRNFHVLAILKETESDLTLVLATPSKLFSYNFKRKTLYFICDFSLRKFESLTRYGRRFPFVENLFPVDFAQE